MESFRIQCTTCKARLRLSDPRLIGQILACPRCGSMVLVTAPVAEPSSPLSEPMATRPAISAPRPPAAAPPVVSQPPIAATGFEVGDLSSLFESDVLADGWKGAETMVPAELAGAELAGAELAGAELAAEDLATNHESAWDGDPSNGEADGDADAEDILADAAGSWPWKTVAIWAVGAMGCVGLVALVTAFVLDGPPTDPSVAESNQAQADRTDLNVAAAPSDGDRRKEEAQLDGASTPSADPAPNDGPDTAASDATTASGGAASGGVASGGVASVEGGLPVDAGSPSGGETPVEKVADANGEPPAESDVSVPSAAVPSAVVRPKPGGGESTGPTDVAVGGAAGSSDNASHAGASSTGAPAGWRVPDYASLFEAPVLSTDALSGPAAVPRPEGRSGDGSSADANLAVGGEADQAPSGEGPVQPQEAYQPQDVVARLGTRVPGLEVDKMPLGQFADLVGQLAGLPVALDPNALAVVSISPRKVVTVRESKRTCEELLDAALKPLRLSHEARGGCVWITVSEEVDAMREVRHAADDLLRAGLTADQLPMIVRQLVAPESWTEVGGAGRVDVSQGKLVVRQTPTVQLQVLQLLEGLRSARGLPTRSKFPAQLFDVEWRRRWSERWSRPLQMDAWAEQPLVACWADVQQRTGAMVLVDWPSLVQQGWGPQSKVTWGVRDRSLLEAVDEFTERHGWFAVRMPTGVLWITSRQQADVLQRLELHRVGSEPNVDGEAVWEEFRRQLDTESASLPFQYYFDPPGRVLVLRAPASLQQRFADYLATSEPAVAE